MRTTLRRVGKSQAVVIPAAMLAECQLQHEVDMTVEAGRLVITPVRALRQGWFDASQAAKDEDAWEDLPADADCGD